MVVGGGTTRRWGGLRGGWYTRWKHRYVKQPCADRRACRARYFLAQLEVGIQTYICRGIKLDACAGGRRQVSGTADG